VLVVFAGAWGEGWCGGARSYVLKARMTSGIESNAGWAGVCAAEGEGECPLIPFVVPLVPLRPWVPLVSTAIMELLVYFCASTELAVLCPSQTATTGLFYGK
jgi:hypothetical protein